MDGSVIIGAGECGTRAAFALREAGYDGAISLIGDEPHLPYERPPLSKPSDIGAQLKAITTAEAMEAAGIDYRQGVSAMGIDTGSRSISLTDGRIVHYDKLLLATGARPRQLACAGASRALDFRTYSDANEIFRRAADVQRVAIIGGGLIGMELAAVLRSKGLDVSIVEAAPKPLGRAVPARFAEQLHRVHIDRGVTFFLGRGVAEIGDRFVLLDDGTQVPSDLTIAAIGVVPEIELASKAGIATGNGILTDVYLRTSDPNIFAAGDCAAVSLNGAAHVRSESWRNARRQAETAARNMAGGSEPLVSIPWFWSDQYDLTLQVVGVPSVTRQETVVRICPNGELEFHLLDGLLVAAASLGTGNAVARDIKLAEMLIDAGLILDATALSDPNVSLKDLLKATRSAA
jgi:3-phenylpropionate/trans-cinnamate dioxygenase ferredoxin reductase subunit